MPRPSPSWILALVLATGCAEPSGGAGDAARAWLDAVVARDADALHALLAPATKAKVGELFTALDATRKLIRDGWPDDGRKAAYAATGLVGLEKVKDPKALFAFLVGLSGTASELGAFQRYGLRVRAADESGATTLGGDKLQLVQDGDAWFVDLSAEDRARLDSLVLAAQAGQNRVADALAAVEKLKYPAAK